MSSKMRFLLRLAVTATALALLVWHLGLADIAARFAGIDWRILLIVAVTLAAQFALTVWRWKIIADGIGSVPAPAGLLARALGASNLYGQLLPASVGGDVIRAMMVGRRIGMRDASVSVITDRLSGLLVLAMLIAVLMPFTLWRLGATELAITAAIALVVLLGLVALFAAMKGFDGIVALASRVPRIGKHVGIAIRSGHAPGAVLLGIIIQLASVTLIALLGLSIGVRLDPLDCLLLVPPALLLSALPISISGWGVREGALVAAFSLVGMEAATVLPVSILYGLTAPTIGLAYALTLPFQRNRQTT